MRGTTPCSITAPATSAFKPERIILPTAAPASGTCCPIKEPPGRRARPGRPGRQVRKGQRVRPAPLVRKGQREPRGLKGRREPAAQRTPIHRTEALNTRFKN